jgi:hypothetical protein
MPACRKHQFSINLSIHRAFFGIAKVTRAPGGFAARSVCPPKKKAWISLDSFGRIGAFQWVTANPNKKILSSSPRQRNTTFYICPIARPTEVHSILQLEINSTDFLFSQDNVERESLGG